MLSLRTFDATVNHLGSGYSIYRAESFLDLLLIVLPAIGVVQHMASRISRNSCTEKFGNFVNIVFYGFLFPGSLDFENCLDFILALEGDYVGKCRSPP